MDKQYRFYGDCHNNGAFLEIVTATSCHDALKKGMERVRLRSTMPVKFKEFKVTEIRNA